MTTSSSSPTTPGHPRPDRRRDRWASLDGEWEFSFDEATFDQRIVVPFAYQSARSGIGDDAHHEVLWYRRRFSPPPLRENERLLVHFGAVDFAARVWVDGTSVGTHRGGHTPFTFDVTDALDTDRAEHELRVRAIDEFRPDQLRGKQTTTFPYLVHYTPTSGIWQSVWWEVTGPCWIIEPHVIAESNGTVRITASLSGASGNSSDGVSARVGSQSTLRLRAVIGQDALVLEGPADETLEGRLRDARPWSPEHPHLYGLRLELTDGAGTLLDTVKGHVGFRTIHVEPGRWLLNGEPLRQRLLLDQGYWPETLLTPPDEKALIDDLVFVKECGFNGVRKHQKIEDPRFAWHADRLGLVVWEELPSPFWLTRMAGDLEADATAEWTEAITRDRNHPCVIAWVPFNESWGLTDLHQSEERVEVVRRMVRHTRAMDPSRPVVDNSGWGHVDTDVVDVHDYDQDPAGLIARWTDIEANGWNRAPQMVGDAPEGDRDLSAELDRWKAFLDPPAELLADDRWLIESVGDTRVWVDGCTPGPGTAGPLVLSEIGGVGLNDNTTDSDRFEYSRARDADDLLARFERILEAVEAIPQVVGWCWTELADVEQECNGLLSADRRAKVDPARIRAVIDRTPWSRHGPN